MAVQCDPDCCTILDLAGCPQQAPAQVSDIPCLLHVHCNCACLSACDALVWGVFPHAVAYLHVGWGFLLVIDLHRCCPTWQVQRIECPKGSGLELAACAWSPCGRHLALAYTGRMGLLQLHGVPDEQRRLRCLLQHPLFFWPKVRRPLHARRL